MIVVIYREHYIEEVRPFYDSDLIKIITGIRRSGKSIIMEQISKEISKKSDNIIYLNFEDKKISSNKINISLKGLGLLGNSFILLYSYCIFPTKEKEQENKILINSKRTTHHHSD